MNELDEWYNQISSFGRLKIAEAKDLYIKAINTQDEPLKRAYMNELILGTLYVVYEYIKRNRLDIFVSSSYDINDIICSFNELWIKKIYNGDLLNVDRYSLLFTSSYFNEVYNNLSGDEIQINEQFGITTDCFTELLAMYIINKNKVQNISYEKKIKEKYYDTGKWPFYTYDSVINIIPLIDRIYNSLNFDKNEDLNLSKTKIYDFLKLIINIGLVESLPNEFLDKKNMEDNILRDIVLENLIEDVDKILTDDRMRQIIHERFGLDNNNPLSLKNVSSLHNITQERVRQIEAKALRKLHINKTIHKYKGEVK